MKGSKILLVYLLLLTVLGILTAWGCNNTATTDAPILEKSADSITLLPTIDTNKIGSDSFGIMVRYGLRLMYNTAYYIGPNGKNGKYLGNKMNCTNCHQQAGTKPYAFNLMSSHDEYPQYRAREAKVLTIQERVNNCVMRPHNGKPLPLNSREMIAFVSYLKWINTFVKDDKEYAGKKPLALTFIDKAANPYLGKIIYTQHCERCHGINGEGLMDINGITYKYPPLWGKESYQPGSSMHRVIKQAQWIKANMPYDSATWDAPILTDEDALHVAAFVNDDRIHTRPTPTTKDYPNPTEKAIDYAMPPFADTFSTTAHKYGPYEPIIKYWKERKLKPTY